MAETIKAAAAARQVRHQEFKPVGIAAVVAAAEMAKRTAPQTRRIELPAILRKEAQLG